MAKKGEKLGPSNYARGKKKDLDAELSKLGACDIIRRMAERGCTHKDIAHVLGCSEDTIQRREEYNEASKNGLRATGRKLRAKSIEIALNDEHPGQSTQLIWLEKQEDFGLNYRDRQEFGGANGGAIQVQWVNSSVPRPQRDGTDSQ